MIKPSRDINDVSLSTVFLLHGLLMPAASMMPLERRLREAGFATRKISYATRQRPWQRGIETLRREIEGCNSQQIHFVGHSMGGLMAAALLNDYPQIVPGSVVTIGTPFNGSSVARTMMQYSPGRWFLGGSQSLLAAGIQPAWTDSRPLHVIAGTSGVGLPRMLFVKDQGVLHDGVVSIDECTLEGVASMDIYSSNHTMLLLNRAVLQRVVELLVSRSWCP